MFPKNYPPRHKRARLVKTVGLKRADHEPDELQLLQNEDLVFLLENLLGLDVLERLREVEAEALLADFRTDTQEPRVAAVGERNEVRVLPWEEQLKLEGLEHRDLLEEVAVLADRKQTLLAFGFQNLADDFQVRRDGVQRQFGADHQASLRRLVSEELLELVVHVPLVLHHDRLFQDFGFFVVVWAEKDFNSELLQFPRTRPKEKYPKSPTSFAEVFEESELSDLKVHNSESVSWSLKKKSGYFSRLGIL